MTRLFTDIHTHTPGDPGRIFNLDPTDPEAPAVYDNPRSVAIHPWRADDATSGMLERLAELAAEPATVAIGETGLDKLRGPQLPVQLRLFRFHADLAQCLGKPMIIHAVRSWNEIMALHRDMRPDIPWIIHGFRGKPGLARQLLDNGLLLSFGARFNPDTLKIVPPDLLLAETDESGLTPAEIATALGTTSGLIAGNISRLLIGEK